MENESKFSHSKYMYNSVNKWNINESPRIVLELRSRLQDSAFEQLIIQFSERGFYVYTFSSEMISIFCTYSYHDPNWAGITEKEPKKREHTHFSLMLSSFTFKNSLGSLSSLTRKYQSLM